MNLKFLWTLWNPLERRSHSVLFNKSNQHPRQKFVPLFGRQLSIGDSSNFRVIPRFRFTDSRHSEVSKLSIKRSAFRWTKTKKKKVHSKRRTPNSSVPPRNRNQNQNRGIHCVDVLYAADGDTIDIYIYILPRSSLRPLFSIYIYICMYMRIMMILRQADNPCIDISHLGAISDQGSENSHLELEAGECQKPFEAKIEQTFQLGNIW